MLPAIVTTVCYMSLGDSWIVQLRTCLMHHSAIESPGGLVPGWLCYIAKGFSWCGSTPDSNACEEQVSLFPWLQPADKHLSYHQEHSTNIFDNLPILSKLKPAGKCNELDNYLAIGVEDVAPGDALKWHEQHSKYPWLSCMALDYLTIPGTFHSFYSFGTLMYL